MKTHILTLTISIALGTAALAHDGVKNEAVKARMALMGGVKDAINILGDMAKGKTPFHSGKAETARAALESAADRMPAAFKAMETDPKSEALPAIWQNWGTFVTRAEDMSAAASKMDVTSLDTLRAGIVDVGASCKGCHKPFRVKK